MLDDKPKTPEEYLTEFRRVLKHYRAVSPDGVSLACEVLAQLPKDEAIVFMGYQLAHMSQLLKHIAEHLELEDAADSFHEPGNIPDTSDH